MVPSAHLAAPARARAALRWSTAGLVLAVLTGCSTGTGAQPAPSAPGTTAAGSSTSGGVTTEATASPAVTVAPTTAAAPTTPASTAAPASASPAAAALAGLAVAASGTMSDYDRDARFGDWVDADGDCQDTRQEVLSRDFNRMSSADGCAVDTGVLDPDPYTARTIEFTRGVATSSDVQIDHVVAAGNAWISGARDLSQAQRVAFYNDPLNLLAVDGPTNGVKSDAAAHEWLPPNEGFHCQYVATQIAVKARYELTVTAPEKTAMTNVLTDCPDQQLPDGEPFGGLTAGAGAGAEADAGAPVQDAPAPAPAPAPPPAPVAPAPAPAVEPPAAPGAPAGGYANCAAARAAGAAPLYAGSPGYAAKLDRDGDGVACEG